MSLKTNGCTVTNGHSTNGYSSSNGCQENNFHSEHNGVQINGIKKAKICRDDPSSYTYDDVKNTADYLMEKTKCRPKIGIICGSGLGGLADCLVEKEIFSYETIPNFPVSTVQGHAGQLVFGLLGGLPVVCMKGRFHYYEGYPICKCAMPVRVMKLLGAEYLIITCAAGGLNDNFNVGDIMIIKDHINFMGFAGVNPLRGPNDERFGTRFPAVGKAYDAELRTVAKKVGEEMGISGILREGVYTCLGGPSFETVAELRAMKILGIDAVGMSTVHEVIVGFHSGMTIFALGLISNKCVTSYDVKECPNHEEVVETGKNREKTLQEFVSRMVLHIKTTIDK